jgi:hypothetical protein
LQIHKNLEEVIKLNSPIKVENLLITPIKLENFYHDHKIVSFDTLFDRGLAEAEEISHEGESLELK